MHTRKRACAPSIVGSAGLGLETAQCTVKAGAAACAIRHQRGPSLSPSTSLSTSLSLGLSLGHSLSLSPTLPWSGAGACFRQEWRVEEARVGPRAVVGVDGAGKRRLARDRAVGPRAVDEDARLGDLERV